MRARVRVYVRVFAVCENIWIERGHKGTTQQAGGQSIWFSQQCSSDYTPVSLQREGRHRSNKTGLNIYSSIASWCPVRKMRCLTPLLYCCLRRVRAAKKWGRACVRVVCCHPISSRHQSTSHSAYPSSALVGVSHTGGGATKLFLWGDYV